MMRWLVVSDMQVPDHDQKAIDSVLQWIEQSTFDGILIVGDECDSPEPSRWNRGYAGEYAGTLQKNLDLTHQVLADFRMALGSNEPIHLMRSNHGDRVQTYVNRYSPALSSLRSLEYPVLLGLDELDITFHRKPFEFAPGWLLAHGDEGSLINTAGGTAMGLAKKWGKSVVCGHTHKAGMQHQHLSVNAKITQHLWGIEVGHLMDMRKANYLKAGSANWQSAVGLITVHDDRSVVPTVVPLFKSKVVGL